MNGPPHRRATFSVPMSENNPIRDVSTICTAPNISMDLAIQEIEQAVWNHEAMTSRASQCGVSY